MAADLSGEATVGGAHRPFPPSLVGCGAKLLCLMEPKELGVDRGVAASPTGAGIRAIRLPRRRRHLADGGCARWVGWGITGGQTIVGEFRQAVDAGSLEIKQIFGDDKQVSVVHKVTASALSAAGPMTTIARSDVARADVAAVVVCGADLRSRTDYRCP